MGLNEQIQTDLRAAMKARDAETVAALRMVLAAFTNARVAEGAARELGDEAALDVLARQAKQRAESAEAYEEAGRQELAAKERAELEVIRRYLPEQLSAEELRAIVDEAVASTGASEPGDMGKVMSAVMPRVKGRADGKAVNQMVRERLA